MSWDIDVSEKLYQRLANEIFFRILHGKYRTGDKMPSYTELAKEAGSSPETVRKAFRELQHYGVIEKMRRGYFVTADEAVVMAYRQQYLTTIALLGSYMICREDQDDTAKSLHLIPVSKAKLTAAKMIVTFVFSILIYLLLFITTFSAEAVLHFSGLSVKMVLRSLKMYLLEGAGVFLAVSPIIAIVPYMKKSYWMAMLLAEIYSFAGLFMSMSNTLKTFYPITAVFGVSGYYEASIQNRICSAGVLLLCACLAIILLIRLNSSQKGKIHDEETI